MILISAFARNFNNGRSNPKDYPLAYWEETIHLLKINGHRTIQVGIDGDRMLDVDACIFNKSLTTLRSLIIACDVWISVDSFFQHYATSLNRKGIVIWGPSDYRIFGYDSNINLVKDIKYLRKEQFVRWDCVDYDANCFAPPAAIMSAVFSIVRH